MIGAVGLVLGLASALTARSSLDRSVQALSRMLVVLSAVTWLLASESVALARVDPFGEVGRPR